MKSIQLSVVLICVSYMAFAQVDKADPVSKADQVDVTAHRLYNKQLPPFTAKTLRNQDFSSEVFDNSITVLHYWSLGCGACWKELPDLNAIVKKYNGTNVQIISLMSDKAEDILKRIAVTDTVYTLTRTAFGNNVVDFEIIPDAERVMADIQGLDSFDQYPFTLILKDGRLVELSFGYYTAPLSDGKEPENRLNYKHLVSLIEKAKLEP